MAVHQQSLADALREDERSQLPLVWEPSADSWETYLARYLDYVSDRYLERQKQLSPMGGMKPVELQLEHADAAQLGTGY
jgi:hypothetical protein